MGSQKLAWNKNPKGFLLPCFDEDLAELVELINETSHNSKRVSLRGYNREKRAAF